MWFNCLLLFREVPFLELTFTSRSFLYKQVCSSFCPQLHPNLQSCVMRVKGRHCPLLVVTESNPGSLTRTFVALQVRRMTGALVAVGQGRLSVPQLKEVLEARDSLAYPQGLAAPAHGLFLTRVDYRDSGTFRYDGSQKRCGHLESHWKSFYILRPAASTDARSDLFRGMISPHSVVFINWFLINVVFYISVLLFL